MRHYWPVLPVGPGGPLWPNIPGGPIGPLGPCTPTCPASPRNPAYPRAPVAPGAPRAPIGPGGPEIITIIIIIISQIKTLRKILQMCQKIIYSKLCKRSGMIINPVTQLKHNCRVTELIWNCATKFKYSEIKSCLFGRSLKDLNSSARIRPSSKCAILTVSVGLWYITRLTKVLYQRR